MNMKGIHLSFYFYNIFRIWYNLLHFRAYLIISYFIKPLRKKNTNILFIFFELYGILEFMFDSLIK